MQGCRHYKLVFVKEGRFRDLKRWLTPGEANLLAALKGQTLEDGPLALTPGLGILISIEESHGH